VIYKKLISVGIKGCIAKIDRPRYNVNPSGG
jgi:hypothetical protein